MQSKNKNTNTNLEYLERYTEKNLSVFPVHYPTADGCSCSNPKCTSIGKHPIISGGFKNATTDINQIVKWWKAYPDANIGIPTGHLNNLVVIDIDPKNGGNKSLEKLKKLVPELTQTLTHRTGSDGRHFLFSYPDGIEKIKSAPLKGFEGIDVKADGGYIVVPPSLHVTGKHYEIMDDHDCLDPEPVPQKLLEVLLEHTNKRRTSTSKEIPEKILEGSRNNTLCSIGGTLRRRGLGPESILAALLLENQAKCVPPLPEEEVKCIVESISRYPAGDLSQSNQRSDRGQEFFNKNKKWRDPLPLQKDLPPVPEVNLDYLPELLKEWVKDISLRMQCPIEYPIAAIFEMLSTIVGKKVCIQPKKLDSSFIVVPNLWGIIIGNPGQKKTPAIQEALGPLNALNDVYHQIYRIESAEYEEKNGIKKGASFQSLLEQSSSYTQQLYHQRSTLLAEFISQRNDESLQEKLEITQPKRLQLITNDATMEILGEIISINQNGILVFRDEFAGLLAQMEKINNKNERHFYLEAWAGKSPYTFDRIVRGHIYIPHLVVSLFGSIQPDVMGRYIQESIENIGNDGFLQRFQVMFYPDEILDPEYIDQTPDKEIEQRVTEVMFNLAIKSSEELGAKKRSESYNMSKKSLYFLQFDDQAQKQFENWWVNINSRTRRMESQDLLTQHLIKYQKLLPALALLLHLLDSVDRDITGPVSLRAFEMAEYWCDVLEKHAVRIYSLKDDHKSIAEKLLSKIKDESLTDEFTLRDVTQRGWKDLKKTDKLIKACELLEDRGYLQSHRKSSTEKGGRPTTKYLINPKIINN